MTIEQIMKRDGNMVAFDRKRIENAIYAAARAAGNGVGRPWAETLSWAAVAILNERINASGRVPHVEEIQDIVEEVLIKSGNPKVAKAYILYRQQRAATRATERMLLDSEKLVENYLQRADWRVNENSNMNYSLQGLNFYLASSIAARYWLHKIYPPEVQQAHVEGDLHIHDLGMLSTYCCGWDLMDLLEQGFGGVATKVESNPPRHLRTALGQLVNFFYTLQGESAGAVAVSNFDTLLAPFVRYDGLDYARIKQAMQEFVFNINVPTRVGFQTPFTNVTMDLVVPATLADEPVIIGGEMQETTYGEFQPEMDMLNRAFAEVMLAGDAKKRVFTFPIPTYNISADFDWDNPNLEPIWAMTAKYGIPYFANFINSDMKPEDARSMCCRLRLDNRELRKRMGGLFAAAPLTGCYDEETEILTENGWKFFRDLSLNDAVATLSEQNAIEFQQPTQLFVYDYEGDMIHFKTRSLDLLVTPNHKMIIDNRRHNWRRELVRADAFDVNGHNIPKQGIWSGEERAYFVLPSIKFIKYGRQGRTLYTVERDAIQINMDYWLAFLGIFIAEGSTDNERIAKRHGYRIFITQRKSETVAEIDVLLKRLPFVYRYNGCSFIICNKQLWTYLRTTIGTYAKNKKIPQNIKQLSTRQLNILFDYLVKGDGQIHKKTGQVTYYTASKDLADDVQELVLKIGKLATLTTIPEERTTFLEGRKIVAGRNYVVGVHKSKRFRLRKHNITTQHYQGKVYCCEVDKYHTLFVRRRGKPVWSGNSVGVVTLNMARMGYLARDERDFQVRVERLMDIARTSLEIKRKLLEDFTERGLYPYSHYFLRNIKASMGKYWGNHFSTIGLNGMHEACQNLLKVGIDHPEGQAFAVRTLEFMRDVLAHFQEETSHLYNLEATPAEGATFRLARVDKERYPDIVTAGSETAPYYTNSTHLPVSFSDDLFEVLDHQDDLQTLYTGGTVLHIFLGEQLEDWRQARRLVRTVAENYRLPYYTLTPTFSICPVHGYIPGEHAFCPYEHTAEQLAHFGRTVKK